MCYDETQEILKDPAIWSYTSFNSATQVDKPCISLHLRFLTDIYRVGCSYHLTIYVYYKIGSAVRICSYSFSMRNLIYGYNHVANYTHR